MVSKVFTILSIFVWLIHVSSQASKEMLQEGKAQYQLLQERGNLPKYGNCWKSAIEHVEQGCNNLSEETQSDMALHLTNCFLQMSGHETYNCERDKKPNLRGICISSMTDRAFNVYTEFYTHTLNICWFLQGQVWQETIAQNTIKVGHQLKASAIIQANLLRGQEESLALQEKILNAGQNLDKILQDFSKMSATLSSLKSWLLGEAFWIDMIIFYVVSVLLVTFVTVTPRTSPARLPIFLLLIASAVLERVIFTILVARNLEQDINLMHDGLYEYVWWCRKVIVLLCVLVLVYNVFAYSDVHLENNLLLTKIYDQIINVSNAVHANIVRDLDGAVIKDQISIIGERNTLNLGLNEHSRSSSIATDVSRSPSVAKAFKQLNKVYDCQKNKITHLFEPNNMGKHTPVRELQSNSRYSLRSKHSAPDSNI